MRECCKDSVKHASSWQFDEGEVECDWCGTYVPVSTVSSELFAPLWPPPSCLNQTCDSRLDHDPVLMAQIGSRRIPPQFFPPFGPRLVGLGPEPPRHASPARQAFRDWLIEDVFGGPDEPIEGDADLIADMISYALEKREQDRVWAGNRLLVDITNLLDLIAEEHPENWTGVNAKTIAVPGPYTGVGWLADGVVVAVAITGPESDESSQDLAQFFEAMPGLLKELQEFLAQPL